MIVSVSCVSAETMCADSGGLRARETESKGLVKEREVERLPVCERSRERIRE